MLPAPNDLTIIFDENISKVELPSASLVWSTSGETVATAGVDGTDYEFKVTLNTGYVIDSIMLDDGSVPPAVLKSQTNNGFVITAGAGGLGGTYTITSKVSASRKEIDLTTLSGWASLSTGSHNITIVAKADGYKDSEPSAAVSVEKAPVQHGYAVTITKNIVMSRESEAYYSLDNGATYIEIPCTYDDLVLNGVTQIKFKTTYYETSVYNGSTKICGYSGTVGDYGPYYSENIILSGDATFTVEWSD